MERAVDSLRLHASGITANAERTKQDGAQFARHRHLLKPSLGYKQCRRVAREATRAARACTDRVKSASC